jgi:hypothetical protein
MLTLFARHLQRDFVRQAANELNLPALELGNSFSESMASLVLEGSFESRCLFLSNFQEATQGSFNLTEQLVLIRV